MPYYKNVLQDEIVGLTESSYPLNVENFYEITEEEYDVLHGPHMERNIPQSSKSEDQLSEIIEALLAD